MSKGTTYTLNVYNCLMCYLLHSTVRFIPFKVFIHFIFTHLSISGKYLTVFNGGRIKLDKVAQLRILPRG